MADLPPLREGPADAEGGEEQPERTADEDEIRRRADCLRDGLFRAGIEQLEKGGHD